MAQKIKVIVELALPIDMVLFCIAKSSSLFTHLPGGLVLSEMKKEICHSPLSGQAYH